MENNYCVYIHRKEDDGEIFYVGIGLPSRPYDKNKRNKFWKRTVNKYGYYVEVIHKDLSWYDAREIEIQLINEYGRKDQGKGNLVNLTDGGEGAYGRIPSDIQKNKVSKTLKEFYIKNPNLIRRNIHHNQEIRNRISKSLKLYYDNGGVRHMLGKQHREDSKIKMSESNKKTHQGEGHPRSKLSKNNIEYIRKNYIKGDKVYGVIGMSKKFNVSKGQISKIINGKRWIT